MGARTLTQTLRVDHGIAVPECVLYIGFMCVLATKYRFLRATILELLRGIEPDAVEARKNRQFLKRIFRTDGGNEFWCMDQHDKMKRYGLRFHVCQAYLGQGAVVEGLVDELQSQNRFEVLSGCREAIRLFVFCLGHSTLR